MNQGLAFGLLGGACAIVVGLIVAVIYYLLTLQKALQRCHPDNRRMQPGMVWLNLVPCLNIVWQFLTAIQVPDSLKAEFEDRGLDEGGDYGKTIGLTYCILGLVSGVLQNIPQLIAPNDPNMQMAGLGLGGLFGIINLALWITFWVRIAGYSRQLADHDEARGGPEGEDYEDRPRRRRPRDEDGSDD